MAYDKKLLVHTGGGLTQRPNRFDYFSSEAVTAAGYFPKGQELKAGDVIVQVNITEASGLITSRVDTAYYLIADADGVMTATALAPEAEA